MDDLYEELARQLQDADNLLIAKFDTAWNEVKNYKMKELDKPIIVFYGKGSKEDSAGVQVQYESDDPIKTIRNFLAEHSQEYVAVFGSLNEEIVDL